MHGGPGPKAKQAGIALREVLNPDVVDAIDEIRKRFAGTVTNCAGARTLVGQVGAAEIEPCFHSVGAVRPAHRL